MHDGDDNFANGLGGESDDEDQVNQASVVAPPDVKLADIDTKFSKCNLWESDEKPDYDRKAGPSNLPNGHEHFSPLQIFLLLFPLTLFQVIVAQTNLYYLQSQPTKLKPLLTMRELFVWIALQLMMMLKWCGTQDSYWNGEGSFDAKLYMARSRFYWIKANLHFADKSKRVPEGAPGWDPLYLLRPLVDTFNYTFRFYWVLSEFISLDEMMINF